RIAMTTEDLDVVDAVVTGSAVAIAGGETVVLDAAPNQLAARHRSYSPTTTSASSLPRTSWRQRKMSRLVRQVGFRRSV
ncbi:MAG: hypothetical protein WKF73_12470, partial [Nocardioidaceae bacterium]